jgi:hypothetical protein
MTRTPVRYVMVFCVAAVALTASQSVRAAAKVAEEEAAAPEVKSNAQEVAEGKAAAPAGAKSNALNGDIEATDLKARTITINHKKQRKTFTVAPDFEVTGAGNKKVTLADLVIGERVKVKYTQEGDKLVAHHIGHVEKKQKTEEAPQTK